MIGHTLGHYCMARKLGEGAWLWSTPRTTSTPGWEVAIKVLAEPFGRDAERAMHWRGGPGSGQGSEPRHPRSARTEGTTTSMRGAVRSLLPRKRAGHGQSRDPREE